MYMCMKKDWILRGIKDGVYTRALHGSHLGTELVANDVESIWIDAVRNHEAGSSIFKAALRIRLEFVHVILLLLPQNNSRSPTLTLKCDR